jgi:hypothetical protein
VTAERDLANTRFTLIQSMPDLLSSAADLWMVGADSFMEGMSSNAS